MWRCIAPGSLAWRIFGGVLKQRAECWAMKKCTQQVVLGWSELSCFLHSSSFFVGSKIGKLEYLCLDYAFMAVSCVSRGIDFHCTHHIAGNSMLTPREGRRPKRQFQMQHTSPDILSSTWATKGQAVHFFHFMKEILASLVICWDNRYLHIAWGDLSCYFTASAMIIASRAHDRCDSYSMPCTTQSTEFLHCFLPLKLF